MKDQNCKKDSQFVIALDGLDLDDNQKGELNKALQKTVMHYLADNVKSPVFVAPRNGKALLPDFGFGIGRPFIWGIIIEGWRHHIDSLRAGIEQRR